MSDKVIEVGQIETTPHQTEEIIFIALDRGWQRNLPVKLITYKSGNMDLHRQTGHNFKEHIAEAEKILFSRGLILDKTDKISVSANGAYQKVIKIDDLFLTLGRLGLALSFAREWLQPVTLEKNMETYTPDEKVQRILNGNYDRLVKEKYEAKRM